MTSYPLPINGSTMLGISGCDGIGVFWFISESIIIIASKPQVNF